MPTHDTPQGEFEHWCVLAHSPGLTRGAARALLAAFGSPAAALDASAAALREVVSARAAAALNEARQRPQATHSVAQSWLSGGPRRTWIALGDPRYPQALLQTADPPLLMYAEGDLAALDPRSIAVVGSRNPTPHGLQCASDLSARLAAQGWVIVSGLALGIDARAHEGALQASGKTVAVVGTGLDQVYPPAHGALARKILTHGGLLLSEFAPGTPPLALNFPQRNRIIAGLAQGVLVVEAALKSGSLITARLAAEAGREVFAVPGSIHSALSRGCHSLIKQGAKLVESVEDILEELVTPLADGPASAVGPENQVTRVTGAGYLLSEEDPLLTALGFEPATLDALCARTGYGAAALSARLLEHELGGQVIRLPGGLFQRAGRA